MSISEEENRKAENRSTDNSIHAGDVVGGDIVFGGSYGESGGATMIGKDSSFYYRCPNDICIYQCMESLRPPDSPPKCPDHGKVMIQVKEDECI